MRKENYRAISLLDMNAQNFNKILGNQILRITYHDQIHFMLNLYSKSARVAQHIKFNQYNTVYWHNEGKTQHEHLIRCREITWQNQVSLDNKAPNKLRIEGNFLKIIKSIYEISTINIIHSGKRLKAFLLISDCTTCIQHCTRSSSQGS